MKKIRNHCYALNRNKNLHSQQKYIPKVIRNNWNQTPSQPFQSNQSDKNETHWKWNKTMTVITSIIVPCTHAHSSDFHTSFKQQENKRRKKGWLPLPGLGSSLRVPPGAFSFTLHVSPTLVLSLSSTSSPTF